MRETLVKRPVDQVYYGDYIGDTVNWTFPITMLLINRYVALYWGEGWSYIAYTNSTTYAQFRPIANHAVTYNESSTGDTYLYIAIGRYI